MNEVDSLSKALSQLFPPTRMEVFAGGRRARADHWTVVVQPRGEGDLSSVFRLARDEEVAVRIGGSEMNGTPTATPGGAIRVDMTGMDRVLALDEESLLIRVQAGISLAVLKSRLSERRLMTGWSIYSKEPHTLGAVLAGGVYARWGGRYMSPGECLRSMTAVLPDGGILSSTPTPRRAAGPDLSAVLLGTLGRLGVISDVTLRVYPWPEHREVLMVECGVDSLEGLSECCRGAQAPHLVEVEVSSDGEAHCMLSLHGTQGQVLEKREAINRVLGGTWDVQQGLPAHEPPSLDSFALTWRAFGVFLENWKSVKARQPFFLNECTPHSIRVSGGGVKARRAALKALPSIGGNAGKTSKKHLLGLKAILDAGEILGPVGKGD